jgi:hypothetical protein
MQRRQALALIGSTTVGALAGCSSDDAASTTTDEDTETTTSTSMGGERTPGDTGTATDTEAPTETASEPETATETETEEPTETPAESQSFGPRTFEGSGTSTTDSFRLAPGPITAEFTHDGSSNFITELLTEEGESYEDVGLTNLIGSVDGGTVASVSASGGHVLNVDADGTWEVTLDQPVDPTPGSLPVDASGEGPSYVGPFEFDGPTAFEGTHEGSSNYIVQPIPVDPSNAAVSIFNEIGQFEGSTTERLDGLFYLNVDADGAWTLTTE